MIKLSVLFFSFLKLGFTAFGGPAMIPYIKALSVNEKKWLDNKTFDEGVAIAQAIPGATAMQVTAYVGMKKRGLLGGLVSYIGFGMPAFILMLILSFFYEKTRSISTVLSIFNALQVIVVSIVAFATVSFIKPIYRSPKELFVAFLAFILFTLKVNPFLIIQLCFLLSQIIFKEGSLPQSSSSRKGNLKGLFILILLFFVFLLCLFLLDNTLFTLAITMVKIDLFAFGGGYASLPLMLHEIVDRLGWIDYKTFMDGIALGQVTPGPIVITATFVGYLIKGFIGAMVATLAVFSPSFLLIFFASEISSKIKNLQLFIRGKKGLLSSFAGLLLFATLKFAGNIDWNFLKGLMSTLCFIALLRNVNIIYVVSFGVIISFFFF